MAVCDPPEAVAQAVKLPLAAVAAVPAMDSGRLTGAVSETGSPDGVIPRPAATVIVVAAAVAHRPLTMPGPAAWPVQVSRLSRVACPVARSSAASSRPFTKFGSWAPLAKLDPTSWLVTDGPLSRGGGDPGEGHDGGALPADVADAGGVDPVGERDRWSQDGQPCVDPAWGHRQADRPQYAEIHGRLLGREDQSQVCGQAQGLLQGGAQGDGPDILVGCRREAFTGQREEHGAGQVVVDLDRGAGELDEDVLADTLRLRVEPQLEVSVAAAGGDKADGDEGDAGGGRPPHGGVRGHVARAGGVKQAPGGDGGQGGAA